MQNVINDICFSESYYSNIFSNVFILNFRKIGSLINISQRCKLQVLTNIKNYIIINIPSHNILITLIAEEILPKEKPLYPYGTQNTW